MSLIQTHDIDFILTLKVEVHAVEFFKWKFLLNLTFVIKLVNSNILNFF